MGLLTELEDGLATMKALETVMQSGELSEDVSAVMGDYENLKTALEDAKGHLGSIMSKLSPALQALLEKVKA
jgi:hypothetical protein